MAADDFAETTGELEVSVAGLVGDHLDALHVLVTIAPRGGDPEDVESMLASLSYQDPIRWEAQGNYQEWIVDLARDHRGTIYQLGLDGSLRIHYGERGRRYALPARRGLTSIWPATTRTRWRGRGLMETARSPSRRKTPSRPLVR